MRIFLMIVIIYLLYFYFKPSPTLAITPKTTSNQQVFFEMAQAKKVCDTSGPWPLFAKDYSEEFHYYIKEYGFKWFFNKRQMIWRESHTDIRRFLRIEDSPMLRCLSENRPEAFIYIPHDYFVNDEYGNGFIRFYMINNTQDTITTTGFNYGHYITSSVAVQKTPKTASTWLKFQDVLFEGISFAACGNRAWMLKILPKEAVESSIKIEFIGKGDTVADYRLELKSGKHHLRSNPIKIRLFKEQIKYMGTDHLELDRRLYGPRSKSTLLSPPLIFQR